MSIRTYTADSMAAALTLMKQDLGHSAVVLQTRTYRQGGFFGFGARSRVEIVAADETRVPRSLQRGDGRGTPPPTSRGNAYAARSSAGPNAGDLIRTVYQAARAETASPTLGERVEATSRADHVEASTRPAAAPRPAMPAPVSGAGVGASRDPVGGVATLREEMAKTQRMVLELLQRPGGPAPESTGGSDQLFEHYLHLLEQDVSRELANDIVEKVRAALSAEQLADPAKVRAAVSSHLESLLPFDASAGQWSPSRRGDPRVIALVGPTGVGKTTTVAKMAANYKLKGQCNVGLITIDTYRIAAVDQLRTYADIIGVPVHVVLSPQELQEAIHRCAGCDVVLIDTAGRSQRDDDKLEELASFITAARPDEVHLVLASTCARQVVLDTVDRFSKIDIDRVIFTKLDEAVTLGVVLSAVNKINKRLSFVTTGQDVPHQIETGRAASIVARMLGKEG